MGLKEKCHTLTAQAICQFLLTGGVPRRNIITKHTLMIHLMILFSLKAHSSGGKGLYTMKDGHSL